MADEQVALIGGQEYTRDEFVATFTKGHSMTNLRAHEVSEIDLAGKTYTFRTPKTAILMAALMQAKGKSQLEASQIMAEMQMRWIRSGVGKEAWAELETRMMDDDDPLDWGDLDAVFKTKTATARPTMSSSDSSTLLPKTTPSEDEPKQPESIFGL